MEKTHLDLRKSLITVLDKTRLFALPLILRSFRFCRVGARLTTPCLLFYKKLVSFLRESSLYNPLVRKLASSRLAETTYKARLELRRVSIGTGACITGCFAFSSATPVLA